MENQQTDGAAADRLTAISQPILEMELRNEDGGKFIMAPSIERISRVLREIRGYSD